MATQLIISLAAVTAIGFAPFVLVNWVREDSLDDAIERTINGAVGIVATVMGVGVAIAGGFLTAIQSSPDVILSSLMGLTGYLTIADLLALTPETYGLLVMLAVGLIAYSRGR